VHDASDFATYSIKFSQNSGILTLDEELRIQAVTLPADEYARCKAFFAFFFEADLQQAVLVKN
jgi:hypothetical protein